MSADSDMADETTDAALPSGKAAVDLVQKPSIRTASSVVGTMVLRGCIIGGGLYLFTKARGTDLLKYTAAATGAVEIAVLLWASGQPRK